MALGKAEFEQALLQVKRLRVNVGILGSQTQASIKTYCKNIPSVLVYHEDDTRTVTAVDSEIGFALTDLDNDAPPAVLGILIPVGDASELIDLTVPTVSIVNTSLSGPMTAAVFTKAGSSTTGVTATLKSIAATMSLTGLNIDEDNATSENCSFWIHTIYRASQPGY